MARKKIKKRRPSPAERFFQRADSDPNVAVLNWEKEIEKADDYITGTATDLIRDGYDVPHPWMHNVHAQPDDRKKAFLVGRGWSATHEKRLDIANAGIPVMAINDYPKEGPIPRYWCSGDPAQYFGNRVWDDNRVMKFAPFETMAAVRPREDAYAPRFTSKDAPNVHFFHEVNNDIDASSWLHTPWINWGTSIWGPNVPRQFYSGGCARSSMLIGLRLLWHLGYREVHLLGCDCTPHHHPYPKYWETMFHIMGQLRPTFDRWKYSVYQTNADSHLRCFEFMDFRKALAA